MSRSAKRAASAFSVLFSLPIAFMGCGSDAAAPDSARQTPEVSCAPGMCDDQDPCTDDFCATEFGQVVCTHADVVCPRGFACDPNHGDCVECFQDTDCDDARFCNGQEICINGSCKSGARPCPDYPCNESADFCHECVDDTECADGIFCNGQEVCDEGRCQPGGPPCLDGQLCIGNDTRCVEPLTVIIADCPTDTIAPNHEITLFATVSGGLSDNVTYAWRLVDGSADLASDDRPTVSFRITEMENVTLEVMATDTDMVAAGLEDYASSITQCTVAPTDVANVLIEAPVSGVLPVAFTGRSGVFVISVSPINDQGDLITAGVDSDNFSFTEITAVSLQKPLKILIPGTATPGGLRIHLPDKDFKGISVAIVLDSTGSMTTNDPARLRVDAAKRLVKKLKLHKQDQAAVLEFSRGFSPTSGYLGARLLQDFTSNETLLDDAINKVIAQGATPLYDALLDAIELITSQDAPSPAIVVLTDGLENASRVGNLANVIDKANQKEIPIFPVGLGTNVDFTELQELARRTGGTFASALNASQLGTIFTNFGIALSAGRIEITTSSSFQSPLPATGIFTISGLLSTEIHGITKETRFSFQAEQTVLIPTD